MSLLSLREDAGGGAAATLGELGYNVLNFCIQDSPRRAHSVAAQGGINASKNYQNDGDSVYRLFYDTIKGGDFRAREANVYRLAQVSENIIDQCVAQGVPFSPDPTGPLGLHLTREGGHAVRRIAHAADATGRAIHDALLAKAMAETRKVASYAPLYAAINDDDSNPWNVEPLTIEVGARGFVPKSLPRFFRRLGSCRRKATSLCRDVSTVIAKCSFAIFNSLARDRAI